MVRKGHAPIRHELALIEARAGMLMNAAARVARMADIEETLDHQFWPGESPVRPFRRRGPRAGSRASLTARGQRRPPRVTRAFGAAPAGQAAPARPPESTRALGTPGRMHDDGRTRRNDCFTFLAFPRI